MLNVLGSRCQRDAFNKSFHDINDFFEARVEIRISNKRFVWEAMQPLLLFPNFLRDARPLV